MPVFRKGVAHKNRMTDSGGIQVVPKKFDVSTTFSSKSKPEPISGVSRMDVFSGDILFECKIKFSCAPAKSGFMFGIAPSGIELASPNGAFLGFVQTRHC